MYCIVAHINKLALIYVMSIDLASHINTNPSIFVFENTEFIVSDKIKISDRSFKNCKFQFDLNGNLITNKCSFTKCNFIGITLNSEFANEAGNIQITNSTVFVDTKIQEKFRDVRITQSN